MLLETFSATEDNVLLYSENRFDTLENFRIIYKQTLSKKPEPLSLVEVIQYINMPADKNLIVYRLLTNLRGFSSQAAKYGIIVKIDNIKELVYLDPVYAIRELEEMAESLVPAALRFRIQQVGLHSTAEMEDAYNEVYSFDLMAEEARNQNDRVFAEAVYAFDESFTRENVLKNISSDMGNMLHNGTSDAPANEESGSINSIVELVVENSDGLMEVPEIISDQCKLETLILDKVNFEPENTFYNTALPGKEGMKAEEEEIPNQHPDPAVKKMKVETSAGISNTEEDGYFFSAPSLSRDISDGISEDPEALNSDPFIRKRRVSTGLPAEYIEGALLTESEPILQDVNNNSETEEGTSGQMTFRDFLARRQFQENSMQEKKSPAGDDGILNIFRSSAGIGSYLNSRMQHSVVLKLEERGQD